MTSRRTFLSLVAGSVAMPGLAVAQGSPRKIVLYTNVGPELIHYDVDVANAELIKRESVMLPAIVQYCWPHRDRRHFYVASSENKPGSSVHHVTAFKIDPATGALTQIGEPIRLPVFQVSNTTSGALQAYQTFGRVSRMPDRLEARENCCN